MSNKIKKTPIKEDDAYYKFILAVRGFSFSSIYGKRIDKWEIFERFKHKPTELHLIAEGKSPLIERKPNSNHSLFYNTKLVNLQ